MRIRRYPGSRSVLIKYGSRAARPSERSPLTDRRHEVSTPPAQAGTSRGEPNGRLASKVPELTAAFHQGSFRYERGYKYATGSVRIPNSLKDALNGTKIALKFWSHKQIPWRIGALVRSPNFDTPLLRSRSLAASLYQLYRLACKSLQLKDDIQTVYLQVFKDVVHLRSRPFQRRIQDSNHTAVLSKYARVWNLSCELHNDGSTNFHSSRPLVRLQSQGVDIESWCSVHDQPLLLKGAMLVIDLAALLKRTVVNFEPSSTNLTDTDYTSDSPATVQAVYDGMVEHVLLGFSGKQFLNPNEVMLAAKKMLLSYLPTSPLADVVDFQHLQVTIRTQHQARCVTNTALTADGREIELDKLTSSGPTLPENPSAAPRGKQSHHLVIHDDSPSYINIEMTNTEDRLISDAVAQDFGPNLKVQTSMRGPMTMVGHGPKRGRSDILGEFDSVYSTLQDSGLVRYALSSMYLSRRFPNSTGEISFGRITLSPLRVGSVQQDDLHAVLRIHLNPENDTGNLTLRLPPARNVKASLKGDVSGSIDVLMCIVSIEGRLLTKDYGTTQNDPTKSIVDEIQMLAEMSTQTIYTICKKMEFDSAEAISRTLASAILSAVQFPNPRIAMHKARVKTEFSTNYSVVSEAYKSTDRSIALQQEQSSIGSKPSLSETLEAADSDTLQYNVPSEAHTDAAGVNLSKIAYQPFSSVTSENGTFRMQEAYDQQTPKSLPNSASISVESEPWLAHNLSISETFRPLPTDVQQKTEMHDFAFGIELSDSVGNASTRTTPEAFVERILEKLRASPFTGTSCLEDAIERLSESSTSMRRVKIAFRHRLGVRAQLGKYLTITFVNGYSKVIYIRLPTVQNLALHWGGKSFRLRITLVVFGDGLNAATPMLGRSLMDQIQSLTTSLVVSKQPTQLAQITQDIAAMLGDNRHIFQSFPGARHLLADTALYSRGVVSETERAFARVDLSSDTENGSYPADDQESTIGLESSVVAHEKVDPTSASRLTPSSATYEGIVESRTVVGLDTCVANELDSQVLADNAPIQLPDDADDPNPFVGAGGGIQDNSEMLMSGVAHSARDRIYIALGSNMGNRVENIERACREMDAEEDIQVIRTSALYETSPMYVEDQDRFLNGVCEIKTTLEPEPLLNILQGIETKLGRQKIIDKGPRNIDLDILLYRDRKYKSDRLTIPHPGMLEREFVLRPLYDIPTARARHYLMSKHGPKVHLHTILDRLLASDPMFPFVPIGSDGQGFNTNEATRKTHLMAILNVTPDSFSDGGVHDVTDMEEMKSTVRSLIAGGATIIDIGGQSSRPNAPDVSAEEEIDRILPAIAAIKSVPEAAGVAISVDTYRAAVAEAAVNAGASIVNDISAGQLDPNMLKTISGLGCTYVMMHMRGTPSTMQSEENTSYPHGLIHTIGQELYERLNAAEEAGIRRWRIILDPGIGFSKTPEQNLEILRELESLRRRFRTLPWLVGSSRKSFIGKITGVEDPTQRGWGTAATVTAAVQGGADIVRVHDVAEMADVVKMADALYRSSKTQAGGYQHK